MKKKTLVMVYGTNLDIGDRKCANEKCTKEFPIIMDLQENAPRFAFPEDVVIFNRKSLSLGETQKKCPQCHCVFKVPCVGETKIERSSFLPC